MTRCSQGPRLGRRGALWNVFSVAGGQRPLPTVLEPVLDHMPATPPRSATPRRRGRLPQRADNLGLGTDDEGWSEPNSGVSRGEEMRQRLSDTAPPTLNHPVAHGPVRGRSGRPANRMRCPSADRLYLHRRDTAEVEPN